MANAATDKELISRDVQSAPAAQSGKINDPLKKWAKELNKHFSKEDIQMANKHMERCSNGNQNSEIPSYAGQNGCRQKVYKE